MFCPGLVCLVTTVVMPSNMMDIKKVEAKPDILTCEAELHEFLHRERPPFPVLGVYGGCFFRLDTGGT